MLDKFKRWYNNNYSAITWFIIGFLIAAGIQELAVGDYSSGAISFAIAGINYLFVKK